MRVASDIGVPRKPLLLRGRATRPRVLDDGRRSVHWASSHQYYNYYYLYFGSVCTYAGRARVGVAHRSVDKRVAATATAVVAVAVAVVAAFLMWQCICTARLASVPRLLLHECYSSGHV